MAFNSYITYNEYVELGGTLPQDVFNRFIRKAQRILDVNTYERIPLLDEVPDVVKEVLVEYIGKLNDFESQKTEGAVISQYSNGVESITFKRTTENDLRKSLASLATNMLPTYLITGSVNFDVREYLQSNGNNS